ncbi:hypothetical protein [Pyxidicoccus caerfyrddinensis]|jgi:predicted RNase H-like nuclease (RuvC/YqgF family)|uniref:hypothetical protein n=1 Tax=Pyxidicoccus caerfyrddinensis TaxID=2709663 RepID=UPI0013DD85B5|nr:hypothetical protein [Pyxidicoccus caerfyrddinensis]
MALDKQALATKLKDTFKRAKEESWTSDQVADALAAAVDAYVRSAEVVGVRTTVRNPSNVVIGSGTQNNLGNLQ